MINERIIDLNHKLYSGREEYHLDLITHKTDDLYPPYRVDEGVWYILQDIFMSSHCETHIEFPYYHNKRGMDVGSYLLNKLIVDALLLDYTHKKSGNAVTLAELMRHDRKIKEGYMFLFNFNYSRFYRTERSHEFFVYEVNKVQYNVNQVIKYRL